MTATDAPTPRRYANGIARRESILDAALGLVMEAGFGSATMTGIAAAAGLSTPGLLRHFADKDAILFALLERFETTNAERTLTVDPTESGLLALARSNAQTTGYTELFARLAGEATAVAHPAHDHFRHRYARLRALTVQSPWFDGPDDATRFLAAWDGLQLQSLYAPAEVDVVAHLSAHLDTLAGRAHPSFDRPPERLDARGLVAAVTQDDTGYAPGRERRAAIVEAAMRLFSREGFHNTSLREIAERTGIPKSTLLHHFSTKEDLLASVLIHRDATTIPRAVAHPSARAELLALAVGAEANAASPGLIEVYTVLSSEGAAPEHPAHGYFEQRMRRSRASFVDLFDRLAAEGALAPGRDPVHEATWLLGLWDGLQLQWLYDHDAVDVAALLRGYVRSVLH
ncbi:TetR/AcrR family transcriptional regulator [Microbacteriaceae bacterium VKM Ac-2855]|nr:TetR/AcrR family transcriptional regulator [Microbacteriaceae bacterium VKM Ac-2855]